MKVPSGVEWYNILILGLALIGIVVNISCLVLLVKRRKCSMFYTLIKVKLIYLFLLIISLTNQENNKIICPGDIKLPRNFLSKIVPKYRTRAILTRGLYISYPIFEDHFFVFKEVFSENSVLMYG
jgi:hypothetical protein